MGSFASPRPDEMLRVRVRVMLSFGHLSETEYVLERSLPLHVNTMRCAVLGMNPRFMGDL